MKQIEGEISQKDKYVLHLLRGKCQDKARQYRQAVVEYSHAL